MSEMDERTDRVIKISKPPSSLKAWLGEEESDLAEIDSLTAYQWTYALLTDREALVRYVMTLEEHWGEATFPVGYTRKVGKLRKALSQELKDEINAGE